MTPGSILVVGGTGHTGGILRRLLSAGHRVCATGFERKADERFDLAAPSDLVVRLKPETIFIAGGWTNVDRCEGRPEEAMRVNGAGAGHVAEQAKRVGAFVVYFSTDYVFDGMSGPYPEDAEPAPINHYGRSKLEGERRVAESGARCAIVRSSLVYGHHPGGSNFFMQVLDRFRRGEPQPAFHDQFLTPTWAEDLARAALRLAEERREGIHHVAGPRFLSRVEFCLELAQAFGSPTSLVRPVRAADVPSRSRRPLKAGLTSLRDHGTLEPREAFARIRITTPPGKRV